MKILPINSGGSHKTGSLPSSLSPQDIEDVIGFPANIDDDPEKVTHSWGFTVDGAECGIWDYKGSRWSTYDPKNKLADLFHQKLGGK